MKLHRIFLVGSVVLIAGIVRSVAAAAEEPTNNGEDPTKPLNRFDIRFQYETLPNVTKSGRFFEDRHEETLTLRSDLVLFTKPDQFALRVDLPFVWSNKVTSENPRGVRQFGLGDLLLQAVYVRTFNERWAAGIGVQTILPTASEQSMGDGKWQLAPTVAVRAELPEISAGSYAGLIVRQFLSVAGSSSRSNINSVEIQPQINLALPNQWFINTSPKMRFDVYTSQWFVPLDVMVGKKFGRNWVASLEYQYGLVREDDRYNQWLEARVGYFF